MKLTIVAIALVFAANLSYANTPNSSYFTNLPEGTTFELAQDIEVLANSMDVYIYKGQVLSDSRHFDLDHPVREDNLICNLRFFPNKENRVIKKGFKITLNHVFNGSKMTSFNTKESSTFRLSCRDVAENAYLSLGEALRVMDGVISLNHIPESVDF